MTILNQMKLLQHCQVPKLKATDTVIINKALHYIQLRNWAYSTYDTLLNQAREEGAESIRRILLDENVRVVGPHDSPVIVIYQYKNRVGAYVYISPARCKLNSLSITTINTLPTTLTKSTN